LIVNNNIYYLITDYPTSFKKLFHVSYAQAAEAKINGSKNARSHGS